MVDRILEPYDIAESVVQAMDAEHVLIFPQQTVTTYMERKTTNRDRWLRGMAKMRASALSENAQKRRA